MNVKVMDERSAPPCSEADYVRVQVCPDPEENTLTLATIERVILESDLQPKCETSPTKRVKKLIEKRRMSLDDAVGFARLYAASKKIRLVLTRHAR